MKIAAILLLFVPSILWAQADINLDHLMTKRIFHCEDVEYNCLELIPRYYNEQKFDSLQLVLTYWRSRCGASEAIIRMEILNTLRDRTFRQEKYGQLLSEFLKKYKRRQQMLDSIVANPSTGELQNANRRFDQFTHQIATEIEPQYTIGSLESAICNFYMNNYRDFEILVKMDVVPEVVRQPRAMSESKHITPSKVQFPIDLRFLLYTGVWQPTNRLSKFSIHPLMGSSVGLVVGKKMYLDFSIGYAFMQSKPYEIIDGSSSIKSRHFENVAIAFEPSVIVLTTPDDTRYVVSMGIGTDWLTVIGNKSLPTNEAVRFTSRSASVGAGLQIPINKANGTFIGCQIRHYFLNFESNYGLDLNGDALTLRITYGATAAIR